MGPAEGDPEGKPEGEPIVPLEVSLVGLVVPSALAVGAVVGTCDDVGVEVKVGDGILEGEPEGAAVGATVGTCDGV